MNKKKFDGMSIEKIEQDLLSNFLDAKNSRRKFIEGLHYLESTKRFRDNVLYKDSSFELYINDKFSLRITTYRKEAVAYLQHPKESVKYGTGLVNKVRKNCGVLKVKKVFNEIDKAKNVSREKINEIIEKHTDKEKEDPPSLAPTYTMLKIKVATLEKENFNLSQVVKDQSKRIERLKKTVKELKKFKNEENEELEIV